MVPTAARAVAGAVGFVGALLGVVFVLWPSLKPDAPPVDKGADLARAQVEPGLTFGQYLDRIGQTRRSYEPAQLRRRGAYVEFDYVIRGYKDKRLPLHWQLIDAGTGAQLSQSADLRVRPDVDRDKGAWNVWVALPPKVRRMYVQIQLFNDVGGFPIGRVRTPVFERAAA
jgi:hypothetical protein